jgi:hypothetical protein
MGRVERKREEHFLPSHRKWEQRLLLVCFLREALDFSMAKLWILNLVFKVECNVSL